MYNISTIEQYAKNPLTEKEIYDLKSSLLKQEKKDKTKVKSKPSKIPAIIIFLFLFLPIGYLVYYNTYATVSEFEIISKSLFIFLAGLAVFIPCYFVSSFIHFCLFVHHPFTFTVDQMAFSSEHLEPEQGPNKEVYDSTDLNKLLFHNIRKQNRIIYKFEYALMKHTKDKFDELFK